MDRLDFEAHFRGWVPRYLGRPWQAQDGLPSLAIVSVEGRLQVRLPAAVHAFYCNLGALDALCAVHNRIRPPEELALEEGYLLFMDENQDVVSWGMRLEEIAQPDPLTWQRNNAPPTEWFPEEKSFVELLESMFDWYVEMGLVSAKEPGLAR